MAKKKIEIEKIGSSIAIRVEQNDGSYAPANYYPISAIRSVEPQVQIGIAPVQSDNNRLNNYPYEDKLMISLSFTSENLTKEYFDIQDVTNQPGWTADLSGMVQALSDINGWLVQTVSVTTTPASVETSIPDVIDLSGESFPYTFPADTYTSATIVVPDSETIEFNGLTLDAGQYGFSGGTNLLGSFELDNPSGSGCYILVIGDVLIS
jgi:hypothetical protein